MGTSFNPRNGFTEIKGAALRQLDAQRARAKEAAACHKQPKPPARCQDVYLSQRACQPVPPAPAVDWQQRFEKLEADFKAHLAREAQTRNDQALAGFAALGGNNRAPFDVAFPIKQAIDQALGVFDAHPVKADLVTDLVMMRRKLQANLQAGQPGSYTAAAMAAELRAILARLDEQLAGVPAASPQGLALDTLKREILTMVEGQAATQRPA